MNKPNNDRVLLIAEIAGENYMRLCNEYSDNLDGMIGVCDYIVQVVDGLLQSEEYIKALQWESENHTTNNFSNRWTYFNHIHSTSLDWYFLDRANEIIERDYPKLNNN